MDCNVEKAYKNEEFLCICVYCSHAIDSEGKPFPFLLQGIIFKLPPSHSSPGRSVHGDLSFPPVLNYTIRMSSRITQTTNRIRERIWTVGPHNSTSQSQIYSRAFIYIQDSIERAYIELQTGKNPEEIAVQVQAMPYPCYNKDM